MLRIGTLDGWQPPPEPVTINEAYWNSLTMEQKTILHYHRNFYQPVSDLPATRKAADAEGLWNKMPGDAVAHNLSGTSGNMDYRGKGRREGQQAIYDANGNLVLTPENTGTYDFYSPPLHPFNHAEVDVRSWIEWGNSSQDTTTKEDRINALYSTKKGRVGLYELDYISFFEILSPKE